MSPELVVIRPSELKFTSFSKLRGARVQRMELYQDLQTLSFAASLATILSLSFVMSHFLIKACVLIFLSSIIIVPDVIQCLPSAPSTVELKKQISCSVQLINNSEEYVAFKVKTTSPKKYMVHPNTGIIFPKSFCNIIVTMQAQGAAPPDMQCRDKFLIQCAEVSSEFTKDEITPGLFTRESGRYIQENKLRVILVSASHSTLLLSVNGASYEAPILKSCLNKETALDESLGPKETLKPEVSHEALIHLCQKQIPDGVQNLPPSSLINESLENPRAKISLLESKLYGLELKLNEAEEKITRLKEERGDSVQDKNVFMRELAVGRQRRRVKVQVGFPFLFVCFISLASLYVGFLLHA